MDDDLINQWRSCTKGLIRLHQRYLTDSVALNTHFSYNILKSPKLKNVALSPNADLSPISRLKSLVGQNELIKWIAYLLGTLWSR